MNSADNTIAAAPTDTVAWTPIDTVAAPLTDTVAKIGCIVTAINIAKLL